ncbi:hypothetical protein HLPR_01790 [Helicovermis profundi]|uniref:Dipeptidase n=2 Tax=Helicovermis profundi TaxID=3065157 RepID=A0AAU9E0U1_9FIRM|nr:hypothetical protein HLPR_01790 [Clostridia bacterium S502]
MKDKTKQTVNTLCDHIDYIVSKSSDKNVGFGFDLCNKFYDNLDNIDLLKDHSEAYLIVVELINRGYSDASIKRIVGLNFYELLLENLK